MMYRVAMYPQLSLFSSALYSAEELREAVEVVAAGRPWGWRPEAGGAGVMEAICDYEVIAKAVAAA